MSLTGVHKRGGEGVVVPGNSRTAEGQPWREGATFQFGGECLWIGRQFVMLAGGHFVPGTHRVCCGRDNDRVPHPSG